MVTPVERLADGLGRNQRQNDSSNRFNGERVLIGVVSRLKTGTVDVREVNTAGQNWIIENVEPIFSQHPLSVGDQVIVWRGSNGRNICAGLLIGQRTDGTFRNGFFAKVTKRARKPRPGPIPDDTVGIEFKPLFPFEQQQYLVNNWAYVSKDANSHEVGDLVFVWRDFGSVIPQTIYTLDNPLYFASGPLWSASDFTDIQDDDGNAITALTNPYAYSGVGVSAPVSTLVISMPSGVDISPAFTADIFRYTATLPVGTTSVTITLTHLDTITITPEGTATSNDVSDTSTTVTRASVSPPGAVLTFQADDSVSDGKSVYSITMSVS